MLALLVGLLFALFMTIALVVHWHEHKATVANLHQERLRIQHEQFVAERRLQGMTQQALQRLLDESRTSDGGSASGTEWHQS